MKIPIITVYFSYGREINIGIKSILLILVGLILGVYNLVNDTTPHAEAVAEVVDILSGLNMQKYPDLTERIDIALEDGYVTDYEYREIKHDYQLIQLKEQIERSKEGGVK